MIDKKRDIFIKIEKVTEIVDILNEIKVYEEELKSLFNKYDKLDQSENKIFENWSLSLEDTINKLDQITL